MGAQQSSGGNDDCNPCFAFPAPFKRHTKPNDPLGSPLPDTPRRKRPTFSSRYDGLEKEVYGSSQSSLRVNNSRPAHVHEGLVRYLLKVDGDTFF